jgi:hypothetical protein
MNSNINFAANAEEKERRLTEERRALKLQRKQRLEALVRKRKANLQFLKKFHEGGCFWLNTILFNVEDIRHYARAVVPKQRAEAFFRLGLGLGKIVHLSKGCSIIRAFSQLMEEWEYYIAGTAMQSVKYMMAKNSPCIYPQTVPLEGMTDLSRPSLYKFQNAITYEYLDDVNVGLELDYLEVLPALCEVLYQVYDKLYHEETFSNSVIYETVIRLDTRIKHHVINCIAKELTDVSNQKLKVGTHMIRSIAGHRSSIL